MQAFTLYACAWASHKLLALVIKWKVIVAHISHLFVNLNEWTFTFDDQTCVACSLSMELECSI